MRKFSRWMPTEHDGKEDVWLGWCGFVLAWVAFWPFMLYALPFQQQWQRKLRRWLEERKGEDIGTFARTFDRHAEPFDPWFVRATWHALGRYLVIDEQTVPLRPTDHLYDDLCIDPDDIDLDLIPAIAARSGRALDSVEANPIKNIETVGDFVRFITHLDGMGS